ncbi:MULTISPECIES: hypothetical protein [Planktothrix]|uniref:hypothetical protein n=1 Tax=Planktothrix TaxID=54304 RepID=UPI00040E5E58|nr:MULTISPECIES: hypothetical protein [Planktothrix]CAD0220127.1 conserved hypothetical protein [Planktothrix agardhii]CAD5982569.1 hypothetical protein NO758_04916 [Planktothrix agardhii]
MSGRESIRGYLVQTLIALFEAMSDKEWVSIRLEPGGDEEKADLIFYLSDNRKRAIQVKSTAKSFQKAEIERYASALENSVAADEYRLILVGNLGSRVTLEEISKIGKVIVPEPVPQIPRILVAAAAHHLEDWLIQYGYSAIPALARELLIRTLTNSLEEISTGPESQKRDEFKTKLEKWVLSAYPGAMTSVAREVAIQLQGAIGASQQTLKREACLEALDIVDEYFAYQLLPESVIGSSNDGFKFASRVRSCYSKLIVACENIQVANQFRQCLGTNSTWRGDDIIDFWNAIRQELGFVGDAEHSDRSNPWIAHINLDSTTSHPYKESLAELARKYGYTQPDERPKK